MTMKANSPEFAILMDAWLAGTSTLEQAEELWHCVERCPECAREFAAASRFEGLLSEMVTARQVESEARQMLSVTKTQPERVKSKAGNRVGVQGTWLSLAAVFTVVGVIVSLLWPENSVEERKLTQANKTTSSKQDRPSKKQMPTSEFSPAIPVVTPALSNIALTPEIPLTERLDAFFLSGVSLDHVPLSQALAYLQNQLLELNDPQAFDLSSLKIKVPAGANARTVSFVGGSIPFLKAVRAVAALAGCDVELSGDEILLKMQSGIFPHLGENRILTDVLAGRFNPDGVALMDDAQRVEELWLDAASLGIRVHENGTAAVSRGQWEALRMVSEARDQVAMMPTPSFAIYMLPTPAPTEARVLDTSEVTDFHRMVAEQNLQPILTVKPSVATPGNLDPLVTQPLGEKLAVTLNPLLKSESLQTPALAATSPLLSQLWVSTTSPANRSATQQPTVGALMSASDLKNSGLTLSSQSLDMINNAGAQMSVLIVPVTNTAP